jgi:GNAT superfamily N-acetyltransferase
MKVRPAEFSEAVELASLWYDGWNDAHASIVPADLAELRTPDYFDVKMQEGIADVRVVEEIGEPLGFHIVKGDELNQIYVREDVRGTGAAQVLINDAERTIVDNGFSRAWLACGIGNERAARFYKKCGWHLERIFAYDAPTARGIYRLDVWRFEKQIGQRTK